MTSDGYAVEISQAADEDFRVALAYYLRVAGRPSAEKFIARYEDVIAYLETVPTAAAKIGATGFRWLPVRSHILVYRIDEKTSKVYVARMHYGSSNWREQLEENAL